MAGYETPTPVQTDAAGDPFSRLNELADPIAPWAVRVAATLRIPDLIAAGHQDVSKLAAAVDLDPARLGRLMRYLAHRGVFAATGPASYALTPMSEMLRDGAFGGMRDFLDLDGAACRLDGLAMHLLPALRGEGSAYRSVHGREAWEDLAADLTLGASFDLVMTHKSRLMAPVIAAAFAWSDAEHVVDVGGGNGVILAEILAGTPGLKGTLMDRPETAEPAGAVMAAAGVADRCSVVGGDFFVEVPAGGDVYLMVNVLHDWNDEQAVRILGRCAAAAGPTGRVVIAENLVDGASDQGMVTRWDLLMFLGALGRERTEAEYAALAGQVGLRVRSTTPTPVGINLLECVAV